MQWQPDGWDARVRVGLLVPYADIGPESEIRAMARGEVGVYATRVPFGAMGVGGTMDSTIALEPVRAFAAPPHLDDAAELLAAAPLNAIGIGFTSSAYVIGLDGERAMIERLEQRTHGIPVVATCAAAVSALKTLGIRRLSIVNPPWFNAQLNQLGRDYYESAGFNVIHSESCGLPSDQKRIRPDELFTWIVQHIPQASEAILVGGNGFRAVGVIDALEARVEKPVLTANQVLLWAALKAAGEPAGAIKYYGRIFSH